jgi:hypothetical protein
VLFLSEIKCPRASSFCLGGGKLLDGGYVLRIGPDAGCRDDVAQVGQAATSKVALVGFQPEIGGSWTAKKFLEYLQ